MLPCKQSLFGVRVPCMSRFWHIVSPQTQLKYQTFKNKIKSVQNNKGTIHSHCLIKTTKPTFWFMNTEHKEHRGLDIENQIQDQTSRMEKTTLLSYKHQNTNFFLFSPKNSWKKELNIDECMKLKQARNQNANFFLFTPKR